MQTKRKLNAIKLAFAPCAEVEIPADAVTYDVTASEGSLLLMLGVPDGASMVKRKVWMVRPLEDVHHEAQNAEVKGSHVLMAPGAGAEAVPVPAFVVVFIERQEQAITRSQHRRF